MIFLLIWSAVFCVAGIGHGSLASWDEAYYALVSREIVRTGDMVRLVYFDTPFYDKPPLYLWVTSFFYRIFGVNEFATRLCSALAGIGTILATYGIGKHLLGKTAALAGAGILLSSTDFLHYARWGTLDITHLFFFTLAMLFYFRAEKNPAYWLAFWLASAGAVMTKGPLIVLVWPVILFDCAQQRDFSFLRKKYFWAGIPAFLLAVLPWHWAAYSADPQKFMQDFVIKNYVSRTSEVLEGHAGTWYYYVRTLVNKYHPWIVLAPAALPWVLFRARKSNRAYDVLLFWVAIVLGFFTFAVQTKLQWYILPLYPALSLLLGAFFVRILPKKNTELWIKIAVGASLVLHIPFSSVIVQDYSPALKRLAPSVRSRTKARDIVYLYNYHDQPAATFYFDRPVRYADSPEVLDEISAANERLVLLARKDLYSENSSAFDRNGFKKIEDTSGFHDDLVLLARG